MTGKRATPVTLKIVAEEKIAGGAVIPVIISHHDPSRKDAQSLPATQVVTAQAAPRLATIIAPQIRTLLMQIARGTSLNATARTPAPQLESQRETVKIGVRAISVMWKI